MSFSFLFIVNVTVIILESGYLDKLERIFTKAEPRKLKENRASATIIRFSRLVPIS
jgi:hypothetical protein